MGFEAFAVEPDGLTQVQMDLVPAASGVFRIFDVHDKLILLDKTHDLRAKLAGYFSTRQEGPDRKLDLRAVAGRVEFRRTASPFETLHTLLVERRRCFPETYREMHTVRAVPLLKFNLRQRFPRISIAEEIKPGVEYVGPFLSRSHAERTKTLLERTFRLRACLHNIRGNDPRPECLYFQTRGCSRPCNGDISRDAYREDTSHAIQFAIGRDDVLEAWADREMTAHADAMDFEKAAAIRNRVDRMRRARSERRNIYRRLEDFNFLIVVPSTEPGMKGVAVVRKGFVAQFRAVSTKTDSGWDSFLEETFAAALPNDRVRQYDDVCLVSQFLLEPVKTVRLFDVATLDDARSRLGAEMASKRRRKQEKE